MYVCGCLHYLLSIYYLLINYCVYILFESDVTLYRMHKLYYWINHYCVSPRDAIHERIIQRKCSWIETHLFVRICSIAIESNVNNESVLSARWACNSSIRLSIVINNHITFPHKRQQGIELPLHIQFIINRFKFYVEEFFLYKIIRCILLHYPWWRHDMETLSVLLALCDGNPPTTAGFDVFNVSLWKRLNIQTSCMTPM